MSLLAKTHILEGLKLLTRLFLGGRCGGGFCFFKLHIQRQTFIGLGDGSVIIRVHVSRAQRKARQAWQPPVIPTYRRETGIPREYG